ncbi:hypothetical protein [Haloarcula litorea]|uniref:hypothetical protein n=1 Tax=Haloarcula litorea TaxID=3032579 RepID=UPI0023E852B2|nr:hypothetical protein [Halomicroarcula sp. GDY20]
MPSSRSRQVEIALGVVSTLVVLYSLVIVQQILLGFVVVALLWAVYLFYLFVTVLARIAGSLETIAHERAAEVTDGGESASEDVPTGENSE